MNLYRTFRVIHGGYIASVVLCLILVPIEASNAAINIPGHLGIDIEQGSSPEARETNEVSLYPDAQSTTRGTWHVDDNAPGDPAPGDPSVSDPQEDGSSEHPYDSIAEGIAAASDGDVVEIADGTYTGAGNKDLDFGGKAITVRSASGIPEECVIDCEGEGRGFYFHTGEGADSVIRGIQVINGDVTGDGGGVFCSISSPTLADCMLSECSASRGGGIANSFSSPTLSNCILSGNSASAGGGAYCGFRSNPLIVDCVVIDNQAYSGGGICNNNVSCPVIIKSTFQENSAEGPGGGIYNYGDSNVTLLNCAFHGNWASSNGGGIENVYSSPMIINCMFNGNTADNGAGVYNSSSNPLFTNCTFGNNMADSVGGGICNEGSNPSVDNCILWNDSPQEIYNWTSSVPTVTYSIIQGGSAESWFGTGCIDSDPLFVDDDGPDNDPDTWQDNDYHLTSDSPCIDAGDNTVVLQDIYDLDRDGDTAEVLPYDLEGNIRFYDIPGVEDTGNGTPPIVDIGGYEYDGQSITIHQIPEDYSTIQEAIDSAVDGDIVEIADGTYTGEGNKNLDFGGKAITVRSNSGDPETCIIDCESDGRGFYFHNGEGEGSILSGVTITNGNAGSSSPGGGFGGGIECDYSSPVIMNCIIRECTAEITGGGMECFHSSPIVRDSTFTGNSSSQYGGGINNSYSDSSFINCSISENNASTGGGIGNYYSNPTLLDCRIIGNIASDNGGGMQSNYSSPTSLNCIFHGNSAQENGGGAYVTNTSSPAFIDCFISQNQATHSGGGMYAFYSSSPVLTNCTFFGNSAGEAGGGLFNQYSSPTLVNCIMSGGSPQEIESPSSALIVTYSLVQGGTGESWFGTGCLDADPVFVDADGADDDPSSWEDNNLRLSPGSPSIDSGDNGGVPVDIYDLDGDGDIAETVPHDLYGEDRFRDDTGVTDTGNGTAPLVDMGACEFQGRSPMVAEVPGEYATIQAAIEAVADGDVVEIADGTYTGAGNKDLDIGGKAITVRSASGDPEACTIDCEADGRGFYFHSNEGPDSIIEGITVANGYATSSSPGGYHGGGIYCDGASPSIINCIIRDNGVDGWGKGGGMYNQSSSSPTLKDCVFLWNLADGGGGGIYNASSSPTVIGCDFVENSMGYYEGGGGMANQNSHPILTNCRFIRNWGTEYSLGGGMCNKSSNPVLVNCLFAGNSSGDIGGGGVYNQSSNPAFVNCTWHGNSAGDYGDGGGIYNWYSNPILTNCILWRDSPQEIHNQTHSSPQVTYSVVQGGYAGEANSDADPGFTDPDGPDDDATTWEDNDYSLIETSPCIDAGNNVAVPSDLNDLDGDGDVIELVPVDLAGNSRFFDVPGVPDSGNGTPPLVDMGAFEFHGDGISVLRVPDDYPTIQAAIDAASDGEIVEIADGTYTGEGNKNLYIRKAITVRSASGNPETCIIDCEGEGRGCIFAGFVEGDTVIAGLMITNGNADLQTSGGGWGGGILCNNSSPSVINCMICDCDSILSGGGMKNFDSSPRIENCTFTGNSTQEDGGGMANTYSSSPTLTNCSFIGNSAQHDGGGLFNNESSNPILIECSFQSNTAVNWGGGVHNKSSCNPSLNHCVIQENTSDSGGGMANSTSSNPVLINCSFAKNNSQNDGGGIWNCSNCSPTLICCSCEGNAAQNSGGCMFNFLSSSPTLMNCAINNNSAIRGGGMYNSNSSNPTLLNCTLCGNVGRWGGGLYNVGSDPSVKNCVLWGNMPVAIHDDTSNPVVLYSNVQDSTGEPWFREGCIDSDPLFIDPDGPDNDPATWEDNDYRLGAGSPCIDSGDNTALPPDTYDLDGDGDTAEPLPFDLDGNVRFLDDPDVPDTGVGIPPLVDMGAYERLGNEVMLSVAPDPFVPNGSNVLTITLYADSSVEGRVARLTHEDSLESEVAFTETGTPGMYVASWDGMFGSTLSPVGFCTVTAYEEDGTPLPVSATVLVTSVSEIQINPNPFEPGNGNECTISVLMDAGSELNLEARIGLYHILPLEAEPDLQSYQGVWDGLTLLGWIPTGNHTVYIHNSDTGARYHLDATIQILDLTAPETEITTGPPEGATVASPVSFEWAGSDQYAASSSLVYAYQVDDVPWTAYGSGTSVSLDLEDGAYVFRVKAKDPSGNEDLTPAIRNFVVGLHLPVVAEIPDQSITEFEAYSYSPALAGGTVPISWSLVDGPEGMEIDPDTGVVTWASPAAASEPIVVTIRATNSAGSAEETWQLQVLPSYSAIVEASLEIVPMNESSGVILSGSASWFSDQTPAGNVPVVLHLAVRETTTTFEVQTDSQGEFSLEWWPTIGGVFQIWASHPAVISTESQDFFTAIGFEGTPSEVTHRLYTGEFVDGSIVIGNLSDVPLSGLSAVVEDVPSGVSIEILSLPENLPSLDAVTLEYRITAGPEEMSWSDPSILVTSSEGANTRIQVRVRVFPPFPLLSVESESIVETMVRGQQKNVSLTLRNEGNAATAPLDISLPDDADWMTIASALPLNPLQPGEETTVTLLLTPQESMPLGSYSGSFTIAGQQTGVVIPFEINCVSQGLGDLLVVAQDDWSYFDPGIAGLAGAEVRVVDLYSGEDIVSGTTDENGEVRFAELVEANYLVTVTAEEHGMFKTRFMLPAGEETRIDAFLPVDFVSYTWSVEEDVIPDQYIFTVEGDYLVNVPFPVLEVEPLLVDLKDLLDEDESILVDYTITNLGLINADDVRLVFGTHPRYSFLPLIENLGSLAPQASITVPVLIEDHGGCYCQRDVLSCVRWGVNTVPDYQRSSNLYYILEHGCCPEEDPGYDGAPSGGDRVDEEDSGSGNPWSGSEEPYVPPVQYDQEVPAVDAIVRVALSTDVVFGRQAFTAELELLNHHELLPFEEISVDLQLLDMQNLESNVLFGIDGPYVSGMTAVDGTGQLNPDSSGTACWTLIPSVDAVDTEPVRYYVAGDLAFSVDETDLDIPLYPIPITVLPVPTLDVHYFLERYVQADSPWTDWVEPSVPFSLGLMVTNTGGGVANEMSVAAAQPVIIENDHGLLIEFRILGVKVGVDDTEAAMTADLGDVSPNETVVAQWLLDTSWQGEFIRCEASYVHQNGLGNPSLSLINSLEVHPTLHVARSDYPDDELPDFLTYVVDNPEEPLPPEALPSKLYFSDGSEPADVSPVFDAVWEGTVSDDNPSVQLSIATVPAGWMYVRTENPGSPGYELINVVRQDGVAIRVPENAWTTHWVVGGEEPCSLDQFHLLDWGGPGIYSLEFAAEAPGAPVFTQPTAATVNLVQLDSRGPASREHAVKDMLSGNYVGADGRLQPAPYWQARTEWSGTLLRALDANTVYRFAAQSRLDEGQVSAWGTAVEIMTTRAGDVSGDNAVTDSDLRMVRNALGTEYGQSGFSSYADLNGDNRVTYADLGIVRRNLGQGDPRGVLGRGGQSSQDQQENVAREAEHMDNPLTP